MTREELPLAPSLAGNNATHLPPPRPCEVGFEQDVNDGFNF